MSQSPKLKVRSIVTLFNGPELRVSIPARVVATQVAQMDPASVLQLEARDAGGRWGEAFVRVAHVVGVRSA